MGFPHFPDKNKYPGVLKPEAMLSFRGKDVRDLLGGASSAILCFQSSAFRHLSGQFRGRKIDGFMGKVAALKKCGHKIAAVETFGFGGPATAVALEELAACGVNRCVAIGVCGFIQPAIAPGDVIVPAEAIRDEGTSYHYLPSEKRALPSDKLRQQLISAFSRRDSEYISGQVWTTDAPYRETGEEISLYQDNGLLGVDMETSAFFCVCSALKMEAACGLVAADSLVDGTWHPCHDQRKVDAALRQLADSAVEALLEE
jgi:uridine phosphorylase